MKHKRFPTGPLLILLLTACASIQTGRSATPSTNVKVETTSPPVLGLTSDERALEELPIVDADDETGGGPKTERVVGLVAIVTGAIVLAGIFYWSYKLATIML